MSVSAGRRRRNRRAKTASTAREPMELLGFEGSRHMIPERLPSARKEKTVGVRVIDLNSTAMESIKEKADTLKRLDLSSLNLTTLNDDFIGSLNGLERIDLSHNKLDEETFPNVFKKLDKLIELNIHKNRFTALPPVLKRLKELRRLKVGGNKLTTTEGLERLKKLQILLLDSNQLEYIPKEIYSNLKRLEILHLANNKVKEIHVDVRFLRYLTDVDVSGNKLTSLPSELLLLPRLEVLNASGNHISRIPSINVKGRLSHKIAHIDLSDNVLIKFPEHLLSMTDKLDICKNKIKSIPGSMLKKLDLSAGQELLIYENPLINPPQDICDCGIKSIVQFFQEAKSEMKVYQGIKVLVLGAPNSGKTSLIQTLVDQQSRLTSSTESTIGVDMYDMDMELETFEDDMKLQDLEDNKQGSQERVIMPKTLQVSFWDFSGHAQYHQAHSYFIQDPALVIMVFNLAEYDDSKMFEQTAQWIDMCVSRNHKLTLLPVGTMADKVDPGRVKEICSSVIRQMNEHLAKKRSFIQGEIDKIESMPHIPHVMSEQLKGYLRLLKAEVHIHEEVIAVSSAEYSGIKSLFTAIEKMALNKDLFPNVMRVIPSLWSEVENYVEDKAWSTPIPFMKWDDYCDEVTKKFGMKHLMVPITRYLNDTGKVIWFSENSSLKDFVFLRPSWLADIIKHIFRHNVDEIDYTMEENFKHNGISLDKFNSITTSILNDGIIERDYLKGAWYGLVPYDSTKAIVEVLVVLLEYFEIGYPYVKPGGNISFYSVKSDRDRSSERHLGSAGTTRAGQERTDSRMSATSVFEKEDQDGRQSADIAEKTKPSSKKKAAKDKEQAPLPKITKVYVPFIRKVDKPQGFIDDYNSQKYNPCLVAVYRFPWYFPPGLFETVCVRALKEQHKCSLLYQWDGGMYTQFTAKPYRLFIERKQHLEGFSYIRVEVRHQEKIDSTEVEHMWVVLLPLLKDIEDILHKYSGAWIQRHMECPNCGDPLSFIGEWLNPKELQGLNSKKCTACSKDINTCYLIQPKEKKRVEAFLLMKLKKEAEKRRASQSMDTIEEDTRNLNTTDSEKNNRSPDLKIPVLGLNHSHNGHDSHDVSNSHDVAHSHDNKVSFDFNDANGSEANLNPAFDNVEQNTNQTSKHNEQAKCKGKSPHDNDSNNGEVEKHVHNSHKGKERKRYNSKTEEPRLSSAESERSIKSPYIHRDKIPNDSYPPKSSASKKDKENSATEEKPVKSKTPPKKETQIKSNGSAMVGQYSNMQFLARDKEEQDYIFDH